MVPRVRAPFSMNFMLPVPEASLLAVDICSADIGCCEDQLCVGYAVVLDEYNLQLSVDGRVVVDHVSHGVDELDSQFCTTIASCCLCTEDKGSRIANPSPDDP